MRENCCRRPKKVLLFSWVFPFLLCRLILPAGMPFYLAVAGFCLLTYLTRRITPDPFVRKIIFTSYWIKIALIFLFFFVSSFQIPILKEQQLGEGLWRFAWDAKIYHTYGMALVNALRTGSRFPLMGSEWPMNVYTAVLYFIFGIHAPNAIVPNALLMSLGTLLLSSFLRQRRVPSWTERAAILLFSFWPSLTLWSTQLLKDTLSAVLILASFSLILSIYDPPSSRPPGRLRWSLTASAVFLLTLFRNYVGISLALACWIALFIPKLFKPHQAVLPMLLALTVTASVGLGILGTTPGYFRPLRSGTPAEIATNTAEYIGNVRNGIVRQKGSSTIDPMIVLKTPGDILRYVPQAWTTVFVRPFPWENAAVFSDFSGSVFVTLEMVLIYGLLLKALFLIFKLSWKLNSRDGLFLVFIFLLAAALGVAVPNLGTLFRLRLQVLIPLLAWVGTRSVSLISA